MRLLAQPRLKGVKRKPYHTAVINQIEAAIEKESLRYGVSRSFVIANALAFVFEIPVESYITAEKKPRKKARPRPRLVKKDAS